MARGAPLSHPALERGSGGRLAPPGADAGGRLALLLQAAALLSHLEFAGRRLRSGWTGAAVDGGGMMRGVRIERGPSHRRPQRLLLELARRLGPGVGSGARLLARLEEEWQQELVPARPDAELRRLLDGAASLWRREHAAARTALGAVHRTRRGERLWVAGPGWFRRAVLADCADAAELERRLASRECASIWRRAAGRRTWLAEGRYEHALEVGARRRRGAVERVLSLAELGRVRDARRELARLEAGDLPAAEVVPLADAAVRVLGNVGDAAGARRWVERALAAAHGPARPEAELVAAAAAWDRGELGGMERRLRRAREALARPETAWRWRHLCGLAALTRGDAVAAEKALGQALGGCRRSLGRGDAAALWNEIGCGRALAGDLAGAERALRHAARLLAATDGSRQLTLALSNLAEIRLRRGRLSGVEAILERSAAANERAGNWRGWAYDQVLRVRFELALGRAPAAIERAARARRRLRRLALAAPAEALDLLEARALGWLGRVGEARRLLAARSGRVCAGAAALCLEPEELPALWALAGERETALAAAAGGALEPLWKPLLSGEPVLPRCWRLLDRLDGFRAARWVADAERIAPGAVPGRRRRRAAELLRGAGAVAHAAALEDAAAAWPALSRYCRDGRPPGEALPELFRRAGYGEARLSWHGEGREIALVDGVGGPARRAEELCGGRLVLAAPRLEPALDALFAFAGRELRPELARRRARRRAAAGLVGRSPALARALDKVVRLAPREVPILIHGETGTGKELVARRVHALSARRKGPFLAVNCAALAESLLLSELFGHARGAFTGADRDRAGVFEAAAAGTVFLDEIGDLSAAGQGMLLRVLQESEVRRVGESAARRVDVRVVAATHRDLGRAVRDSAFREDLYYRLRVGAIGLPPLRERGQDVLLLAEHFLAVAEPAGGGRGTPAGPGRRLSAAARSRLLEHTWPGNVRELKNVLAVAVALADGPVIEARQLELPAAMRPRRGYRSAVRALRRKLVRQALAATGGNRAAAARRLGISRQALGYLIRTLRLESDRAG